MINRDVNIMAGATCVCLAMKRNSEIISDIYYYPYDNDFSWRYATNVKTWYKKSSESTWTQYNTEGVLGRPAKTFQVPLYTDPSTTNKVVISEIFWKNPHWFHNMWRWTIDGLESNTEYNIKVEIWDEEVVSKEVTVTIRTDNYSGKSVFATCDSTLQPSIQNTIYSQFWLTKYYMEMAGLDGTHLGADGKGIVLKYDRDQTSAACAHFYDYVKFGKQSSSFSQTSNAGTLFHELQHYFGVGGVTGDGLDEERVNYFASSENNFTFSSSFDPITGTGGTYCYARSGSEAWTYNQYIDTVFEFCQGVGGARFVRFLEHSNFSEAQHQYIESIFMMRALHFEDITFAGGNFS